MLNKNKLAQIAKTPQKNIIDEAKKRQNNRKWLKYSQEIALLILDELEYQKISQKVLAIRMGVTPQYINKLVRGKQKLNIETIARIETALGLNILNISKPQKRKQPGKVIYVDFTINISKKTYSFIQEAQG